MLYFQSVCDHPKLTYNFILYVRVKFQQRVGVTWRGNTAVELNTALHVKILRPFVVTSASVATVCGHTQSSLQVISPGGDLEKWLTYMLWLDGCRCDGCGGFHTVTVWGEYKTIPQSVIGENARTDLEMIHEATIMDSALFHFQMPRTSTFNFAEFISLKDEVHMF